MTLTFATVLFVPLAMWALLRPRRMLVMLMACVGFSSTAVANFPSLAFGLQPYHLFGAMLIARALLNAFVHGPERPSPSRVPLVGFVALLLSAPIALMLSPTVTEQKTAVAQLGHLGFGVAVAWALAREVRSEPLLTLGCRSFEIGALAIAGWGLFQAACAWVGVHYPTFIFNNSVGRFAGLFGTTAASGSIVRIGSVATEPSFLARTLVIALGLMNARPSDGSADARRRRALASCVLLVAVVLTTSTTGLFGIGVLALIVVVMRGKIHLRAVLVMAAVVGAVVLAFTPRLSAALHEQTFGKSSSWSYQHRKATQREARQVFESHRLTGVGLGNQTSNDLAYKVLSNVGLVGAVAYAIAVAGLFALPRPRRGATIGAVSSTMAALKLAVLLSIAMDWVAGWSYTYGDFWVIGGLLMAAANIAAAARDAAAPDAAAHDGGEPDHAARAPAPASATGPVPR